MASKGLSDSIFAKYSGQQPNYSDREKGFMQRALALAKRAWGKTHPNPMVGAVIVERGQIVAEGWHSQAGEAHAEVCALKQWSSTQAADATLYVTLEPCCTQGNTPPCTEAILRSGIQHLVVGALDPNPHHAGRGIDVLRKAGLDVKVGLLAPECNDLNLIFNHWIVHQTPFFAGKAGLTLDGRIATRSGASKWITGNDARADVMHWRRYFPGIAVGSGTVISDNPSLTSRKDDKIWSPQRLVFDRHLQTITPLPRVYTDSFSHHTIVVTSDCPTLSKDRKHLRDLGITVWEVADGQDPKEKWLEIRQRCSAAGLFGVLFEGGTRLFSELLAARQLDYFFAYQAPKFFADAEAYPLFQGQSTAHPDTAFSLHEVQHTILGSDVLTRGKVSYTDSGN